MGKVAKLVGLVAHNRVSWLLLFVPISLAVELLSLPRTWLFVTSAIAIIPLAAIISDATGELSSHVGSGIGGLLNATFGNAPELIIAIFALRQGLNEVVKASISGSIIGNVLLSLGLSMVVGGWGKERQTFNQTRAGAAAATLFLSTVALVMPAIFDATVFGSLQETAGPVEQLSVVVALVLIATYGLGLVFTLRTHSEALSGSASEHGAPVLSVSSAVILLFVATVVAAFESEALVSTIDEATKALGLTEFFVGVIVVSVVGNAAEYVSAINAASQNRMQLAVNIAVGSSVQIAAFVAPILVFASLVVGHPLSLVFNVFEIAGVTLAVLALSITTLDGETNWFEGAQLVAVYLILAAAFFFVPGG